MNARRARLVVATIQGTTATANLYLLALLAAGASGRGKRPESPPGSPLRIVVLVPAHNEEADVASAVRALVGQRYPSSRYEVVVIADNCRDATAAAAASAGATVWERNEPAERSKGHALAWALERVWSEWPDVDAVAVVDADCIASPNFLDAMDAALRRGARAAQARYLVSNPDESSTAALRWAGFALMHVVRPRGKRRLGFSCGLFGTGMAFSSDLLREMPWTAFSLAEDVEYHLRLVARGDTVAFVDEAHVASPMPTTQRDAQSQQMRWETGNARLIGFAASLLARGVARRDRRRVAAAFDRFVPAQSMLAVVTTLAAAAGLALGSRRMAVAGGVTVAGQATYVIGGLASVGAPPAVWKALVRSPPLVAAKLSQTARIFTGRGPLEWIRTTRQAETRARQEQRSGGA
jgi:glycosyltransferase involved in cell wall biosynthesis